MEILNLYSGLGGNRKLWNGDIEVTAVELDKETAAFYQSQFPCDTVINSDAHEYLRRHYNEFDFIWTSPPCQTHSKIRKSLCVERGVSEAKYPDMTLYQEIIFLKHHAKGHFCVENVQPYYDPLVRPDFIISRHLFWTNINLSLFNFYAPKKPCIEFSNLRDLENAFGFDLTGWNFPRKVQRLRNCVQPELGKHILDCMTGGTSLNEKYIQPSIETFLQAVEG